jgi:beta-galactosidase
VALNEDLFPLLETYVRNGGRLVLDAPGGWWNEQGKVLNTGRESAFEKLFGASIADFQYANNVVFKLGEHKLNGFVLHLKPTTAKVEEQFQNSQPAVTVNALGKGQAVILAADASFAMKRQGNTFMEVWTVKHTMGTLASPYRCAGALVYRLAALQADHYFFMNDDEPKTVQFSSSRYNYKKFVDALTGEAIDPATIALEGYSGRWLRAEK